MAKLTVDFSDRVNNLLQKAADRNGLTKVDVLRRAITLFEYVNREVIPGKTALAIVDAETGKIWTRIVVV
jgi:predicted transcriptional regulator